MNQVEYEACRKAASMYKQQMRKITRLEERIAYLEERMDQIDREDAEVFALVRLKQSRK